MTGFTDMEKAALRAIISETPALSADLERQLERAVVTKRENNRQLDEEIAGLCGTGLARVTAYGWATETPGRFGHLGVYSREFFVDEVVDVGPPPSDLVVRMRQESGQPENANCR